MERKYWFSKCGLAYRVSQSSVVWWWTLADISRHSKLAYAVAPESGGSDQKNSCAISTFTLNFDKNLENNLNVLCIWKSKNFSAGIRCQYILVIFPYTLIPMLNNFELLAQLKFSNLLIWLELFSRKCKFHENRDCVCVIELWSLAQFLPSCSSYSINTYWLNDWVNERSGFRGGGIVDVGISEGSGVN